MSRLYRASVCIPDYYTCCIRLCMTLSPGCKRYPVSPLYVNMRCPCAYSRGRSTWEPLLGSALHRVMGSHLPDAKIKTEKGNN
jgi:hypothetical protein